MQNPNPIPGFAPQGTPNVNEPRGYFPRPTGEMGHFQAPRFFGGQPPLPPSPPPPLPMDPPLPTLSSQPQRSPSLFPVPVSSSSMMSSACSPIPEVQSMAQTYSYTKSFLHTSTGFATQV